MIAFSTTDERRDQGLLQPIRVAVLRPASADGEQVMELGAGQSREGRGGLSGIEPRVASRDGAHDAPLSGESDVALLLEEFGELGVRTSRVTEHRVDRARPRQRARGVPNELPKLEAKFSNRGPRSFRAETNV